ncbi:hypothetical protein AMS68_002284 [Peltaster fructicola]|uniref:GPR1/FUN34/YaaH-class plasma membrane protein n=1 Tax=Peltaster fructicola TaxID=286661 RepID=A0A6H0XPS9_9PEZI|nr:hypothetical protein AMS68_002284 [Peltaster fructicola]
MDQTAAPRRKSHTSYTEAIEHEENVLKPTPSQFEKLYLAPEQAVAGNLRLTFANPTPIALGGFVLANTPATMMLMGWHGAGAGTGNASAGVGLYFFMAAILLYAGGIGEWILGNTFPATVFFTFGGFWAAFGATQVGWFGAVSSYGDDTAAFYSSFAMFLIFMAVLCAAYTIAALRTNICLVIILFCFTVTFPCLTASYFYAADGMLAASNTCRIVGAAFAFVASIVAWYLWFSLVLESVDFPIALPVGDLSRFIKGRQQRISEQEQL